MNSTNPNPKRFDAIYIYSECCWYIFSLRVGTMSVKELWVKNYTIKSFVLKGGYQQDQQDDFVLPISLDLMKKICGWISSNFPKRKLGNNVKAIDVIIAEEVIRSPLLTRRIKELWKFSKENPLYHFRDIILCSMWKICATKPQGRKFITDEAIFGWTSTTMSWNRMARSHSFGA